MYHLQKVAHKYAQNPTVKATLVLLALAICLTALFLYVYDLVGSEQFGKLTLLAIGVAGVCALIAMGGVAVGRLEDPEEEISVFDAEDSSLSKR